MSGLGFTRSDTCSIRAIASQGRIAGAARGVLSADGNPLADDDQHEPLASSIDRAVYLSMAAAVLALRPSRPMSPIGTLTRSSAHTARQG